VLGLAVGKEIRPKLQYRRRAFVQRTDKKNGTLSPERTALLTALGVVWDQRNAVWQSKYRALMAIRDAGDEVNITNKYPQNPQLGNWLQNQRPLKKRGKLAANRIDLLTALGVAWELRKPPRT
jgi:hypothetical protein